MLYGSKDNPWTVGQSKSLRFYFTTEYTKQGPTIERADKIATSLRPIGPTILVEWEEETIDYEDLYES